MSSELHEKKTQDYLFERKLKGYELEAVTLL